jgi:hypothetical protein
MPRSYKVIISAEAEWNIGEAYLWIAQSAEDAADRCIKALSKP